MSVITDWIASLFDSHVSPGDIVVWLLLGTVAVFLVAYGLRLLLRWDDSRNLSQHERANQTTTWVLVVLIVSLLAISSMLAMLSGLA